MRDGSPARVEYALTEMGRELAPALRELREWALRWLLSREISARRAKDGSATAVL